eukprot:6213408-Pleurochrysis_carterae.AAC.2
MTVLSTSRPVRLPASMLGRGAPKLILSAAHLPASADDVARACARARESVPPVRSCARPLVERQPVRTCTHVPTRTPVS